MSTRIFLVSIVTLSVTLFTTVTAQSLPPVGSLGAKDLRGEADSTRARSVELDRVKRDAEKPDKKPEEASSFPQIKDDFERIQIINTEVLQAAKPGATLDYERISDAAAEIRKRASRLGSSLILPKAEKQEEKNQVLAEPRDLKLLLRAVDGAILRFVNNPIFLNTKVVNPDDSEKARRDLDQVIDLSAKIIKEVNKLKKTH